MCDYALLREAENNLRGACERPVRDPLADQVERINAAATILGLLRDQKTQDIIELLRLHPQGKKLFVFLYRHRDRWVLRDEIAAELRIEEEAVAQGIKRLRESPARALLKIDGEKRKGGYRLVMPTER